MSLDPAARTQAIYNALLAANPTLASTKVSDSERASVKAQLQALFGTDTSYLLQNTVVLPGSLYAPQGAAVQVAVPAGSGTVTSPSPPLQGTGRIL